MESYPGQPSRRLTNGAAFGKLFFIAPCSTVANHSSFNCWSASCALRRWPTVFLSSPPFFHGLHSPQALLFCALNRRWVSLVFMFIHSTASSPCLPQYRSEERR